MKTLQEIKDEVAKEFGYSAYRDFVNGMEDPEIIIQIAERYATEKARESVIASLEKAAENARSKTWYSVVNGDEDVITYKIDKNSITSEENIIIK